MTCRFSALMTVIVSWPLLATKTRLPSGEITTFQGSAPVRMVRTTLASKPGNLSSRMRMTLTLLPAALAT